MSCPVYVKIAMDSDCCCEQKSSRWKYRQILHYIKLLPYSFLYPGYFFSSKQEFFQAVSSDCSRQGLLHSLERLG